MSLYSIDDELAAMAEELRLRYDRETDIRYAAARLWIDAISDPAKTHEVLISALDVGVRNRELSPSAPGFSGLIAGEFQVRRAGEKGTK
jgi:3-methylcrotonyl-CoA carboxylase beta subunit